MVEHAYKVYMARGAFDISKMFLKLLCKLQNRKASGSSFGESKPLQYKASAAQTGFDMFNIASGATIVDDLKRIIMSSKNNFIFAF